MFVFSIHTFAHAHTHLHARSFFDIFVKIHSFHISEQTWQKISNSFLFAWTVNCIILAKTIVLLLPWGKKYHLQRNRLFLTNFLQKVWKPSILNWMYRAVINKPFTSYYFARCQSIEFMKLILDRSKTNSWQDNHQII